MFSGFRAPKRNVPVPALPIHDLERPSPSTSPLPLTKRNPVQTPRPNHLKSPSVQSSPSVGSGVTDDEFANNVDKRADYMEMLGNDPHGKNMYSVGSVGGWSSGAKYGHKLGERPSSTKMPVVKEGWIWRKGRLGSYKQCYIVIRQGERTGMIFLFKSNQSTFPFKSINLSECTNAKLRDSSFINQIGGVSQRSEFKIACRKGDYYLACDQLSEAKEWIDIIGSLLPKITEPAYQKVNQELATIYSKCSSLNAQNDELEQENDILRQNIGRAHVMEREKEEELLQKLSQYRQNETALKSEVQALTAQIQSLIDANSKIQRDLDQERRNSLTASNNHTLLFEIRCLMDEKLKLPESQQQREQEMVTRLTKLAEEGRAFYEDSLRAQTDAINKASADLFRAEFSKVAVGQNNIQSLLANAKELSETHYRGLEQLVQTASKASDCGIFKLQAAQADLGSHVASAQKSVENLENSVAAIMPKISAKMGHDLKANNQVLAKDIEQKLELALESKVSSKLEASLLQHLSKSLVINAEKITSDIDQLNKRLTTESFDRLVPKLQELQTLGETRLTSKTHNQVALLETTLAAKLNSISENIIETIESSVGALPQLSNSDLENSARALAEALDSKASHLEAVITKIFPEICSTQTTALIQELNKQFAQVESANRFNTEPQIGQVLAKLSHDMDSLKTEIAKLDAMADTVSEASAKIIQRVLPQVETSVVPIATRLQEAIASQIGSVLQSQTEIKNLLCGAKTSTLYAEQHAKIFLEPVVKAAARANSSTTGGSKHGDIVFNDDGVHVDALTLATRFVTSMQDGLANLQIRLSRMDVDRQRDADLSGQAIQQLYDSVQHVQKTLSDVLYDNEKGGFVSSRSSSPVGSMKRLEQTVDSMRAEISKQTDQILKSVEQKLQADGTLVRLSTSGLLAVNQQASASTLVDESTSQQQVPNDVAAINNISAQFCSEIANAKSQLAQLYREKQQTALELENLKFQLDISKLGTSIDKGEEHSIITASLRQAELDDSENFGVRDVNYDDCVTPSPQEDKNDSPSALKGSPLTPSGPLAYVPERLTFV